MISVRITPQMKPHIACGKLMAPNDDNDEDRQKDVVTEGEGVGNDDLQLANQFGSVMDIASHCDKRDGVANWEHSAGVMLHDTGTYTPFPVLPQPLVPWT
jgi:hypothetical protein